MKSLNKAENLWNNISVEVLENRDEFAACITCLFDCFWRGCICFDCFGPFGS